MGQQTRPKHQHFVPKNHLRRFLGPDGRLYVFDKTTGAQFAASENKVGGEMDFYFSREVEEALAEADCKFKTIVDDVLQDIENGIFTPEHKAKLAPYMALQAMRTREVRNLIHDFGTELTLLNAREQGRQIDPNPLPQNYVQYCHLLAILDPEKRQELALFYHNDHLWFVGINETPQPFWTSDAPVILRSHAEKGKNWRQKAMYAGAERQFALNPKYILLMLRKQYCPENYEDQQGRFIRMKEQYVLDHNMR